MGLASPHNILDAISWARDVAVVRAMLVLLLMILLALCSFLSSQGLGCTASWPV